MQLIITALAVGTGVGVNTQMARLYAQKKEKEADETAIQYGITYGKIVCIGSIGIFLESIWTKVLQAGGNMRLPMIAQIAGAVTNIILDPILIFGMFGIPELGIAGAAIATVCGQIVAAVITGTRGFRMPPAFHEMKNCIKWIYRLGYPSILMQMLYTVYIVALNIILAVFSDAAVTVLGLYYKMQTFFFIPLLGLQTCIVPAVISLLSPVFFQAIGNAKASALLSLIRQLGCLIPIFWAFSKLGLVYTWIAFPAAEVITGVIGIVLYIRQIKKWSAA